MNKNLLRGLTSVSVLGLFVSLVSSLGARDPRAQERPMTPLRPQPSEIRTAPSAPSSWVRNYGGFFDTTNDDYDWLFDAQPAWDGGVVLAGTVAHTFEHTIQDVLVMEVGPSGEVVWQVLYEADPHKDSYNDARGLTRTRDGGYLVVGSAAKFNSLESAGLVMKLGPLPEAPGGGQNSPYRGSLNFGLEWAKSYHFSAQGAEDSWIDRVVETRDGGLVLSGYHGTFGPSAGSSYWLMKLDPAGNVLWREDVALAVGSIIPAPDGGVVAAGDANDGVQVVKFDSEGRIQWAQTYQEMDPGWGCDDYTSYFSGISLTSDGGCIMAGTTTGCECCHNEGIAFSWVCKLDQDGRIVWSQGYDFSGIGPILQTTDGGYLMPHWGELIKVDSSGSVEWVRSYAGLEPALAFRSQDGGYLIAGSAEARLMVMRLDSAGHLGPTCSMESDGAAATRTASIRAVSTTLSGPSENSVRVTVLENTPFPRTCVIRGICPWSRDSQSQPSRKSVPKE